MAWEYKQVMIDRTGSVESRQKLLDQLGADNWELKTQLQTATKHEVLVFARPKIEEASAPTQSSSARPLNG